MSFTVMERTQHRFCLFRDRILDVVSHRCGIGPTTEIHEAIQPIGMLETDFGGALCPGMAEAMPRQRYTTFIANSFDDVICRIDGNGIATFRHKEIDTLASQSAAWPG